jgi:REP element-mobilizing transposase RayT
MHYRRINAPGGTIFFTLVTYQRRPIFGEEHPINLPDTTGESAEGETWADSIDKRSTACP